jgi:hypothetical protein
MKAAASKTLQNAVTDRRIRLLTKLGKGNECFFLVTLMFILFIGGGELFCRILLVNA